MATLAIFAARGGRKNACWGASPNPALRDKMELLTKWPLKISNGNLSRKKDAHWRHFVFHINRFRFKAVAERRQ